MKLTPGLTRKALTVYCAGVTIEALLGTADAAHETSMPMQLDILAQR